MARLTLVLATPLRGAGSDDACCTGCLPRRVGWVGGGVHQGQLPSQSSVDTRANTIVHRGRSTGQQRTHRCREMRATCELAPRRNQHSWGPATWGPRETRGCRLHPPPSRQGATASGPRPHSSQSLLHVHTHGTHHPSFLEGPPALATT